MSFETTFPIFRKESVSTLDQIKRKCIDFSLEKYPQSEGFIPFRDAYDIYTSLEKNPLKPHSIRYRLHNLLETDLKIAILIEEDVEDPKRNRYYINTKNPTLLENLFSSKTISDEKVLLDFEKTIQNDKDVLNSGNELSGDFSYLDLKEDLF